MARSDTVYEVLRSRIVSGDYPPGSHLAEEVLSEEHGVSRTPIRAALRRLHADNLITLEPRRGAFVAEYTESDIDEVFELRQLLEQRGAALAATRRTVDQVERLRQLVDQMADIAAGTTETRRDDLHHNNRDFHELVLAAANSPRQYRFAMSLAQTSITVGTFFYYTDEDIRRSIEYHRLITQAIADQQDQVAGQLMSAHLTSAHHAFICQRFGHAR